MDFSFAATDSGSTIHQCVLLWCIFSALNLSVPGGFILIGTVSAKIAPRLKCYKNASRLNRYNFPTDNAIDFLFSILHTTPFHYEVLKIGSHSLGSYSDSNTMHFYNI